MEKLCVVCFHLKKNKKVREAGVSRAEKFENHWSKLTSTTKMINLFCMRENRSC